MVLNCTYVLVCVLFPAFCPYIVTNTTRGSYLWPGTSAEDVISFPCVYGAVAGGGPARRNCSDRGVWIEVELSDCLTFSNSLLLNISDVCMSSWVSDCLMCYHDNIFQLSIPEHLDDITTGLIKAIGSAVNEEDQSEQNLNLILNIMRKIADYCGNDSVSTNRFCVSYFILLFMMHSVS